MRIFFMLLCAVTLFAACKDEKYCVPENDDLSVTDSGVTINGVTWATRNVDAPGRFVVNPEDYGITEDIIGAGACIKI